jgi:signal transduction histidine kinase
VIRHAARLLVERVADGCAIDLVEDPESDHPLMTRTTAAARDPAKHSLAEEFEKIGPGWRSGLLTLNSPEARQTIHVPQVTDEYLDSIAKSPEHRRLLAALEPKSIITVALQARGLMLGVLALVSSDPNRHFDESDVAFAEEVAQRLALAIDNARLFEITHQAITARDDILRVVAHDLRNPLGSILMRASMLQTSDAGSESDRRKHAAAIETAARRMSRLIQDLLDVTRFEAGRLSVDKHAISADRLVSDVVTAQMGLAEQAKIDLRFDMPPDLPEVHADHDRLLQVFENLVGNALKLTPSGGRIVVGAWNNGPEVTFFVRDTGVGISDDEVPHVFDRFWQGRHHKEGAGLGLPIVKALVEAHGGRVWVESTPGRGSTFYFTIPVATKGVETQPSNRKAS